MSKYKYILFDADNTLFDFDKCERAAFKAALAFSPLDYSDSVYSDYHVINDGLWKLLEKGGIEREVLKSERFRLLFEKYGVTGIDSVKFADKYESLLGEQSFEIDGVYDLLKRLSGKYDIYVITNGLTNVQESRFARSRMTSLVKDVYISEKVGYAKPDKRYFDFVVSHVGDPDLTKYIVVGDSLTSDIDGAINSGIDCCWYNRRAEIPENKKPTYIIDDILSVETVLEYGQN